MFGNSSQFNAGNFFIALRPKDEGRKLSADEIIAPAAAPLAQTSRARRC